MLSLHRSQRKQKHYSNLFRIRTFLILSLLIWNCNDKNVHTLRSFLENHTDSRTKWAKCIPVFRPKRRKTPIRWEGTHLYGLYNGVPSGTLCPPVSLASACAPLCPLCPLYHLVSLMSPVSPSVPCVPRIPCVP